MNKIRSNFAISSLFLLGATCAAVTQAATCEYTLKSEWNSGFTGTITITNDSASAINGWKVNWAYSDGSKITNLWNANFTGNNPYSATNLDWNGSLNPGESASFGFQGNKSASSAQIPEVTGDVCGGTQPPDNTAPVADITANPLSGTAPLVVNFDASNSSDADGDSLSYVWDFGDGTSASGVTATHTYRAVGKYTAKLTVNDGKTEDNDTVTINVVDSSTNAPPTAVIKTNKNSGPAPLTVNFDATQSSDPNGDPLTFLWNFGDGTSATGGTATHTYTANGTYKAELTVSDGEDSVTVSTVITVRDNGNPAARVDNPFRDARWYVNEDWSAKAAAEPGGSAIAGYNTAVWMDRIGAIEGTATVKGLREHLDAALDQGAELFLFVVYNLPNRDCNALASNGELLIADGGMKRYKEDYIDPIASILADPAYASLRIAAIIEIDSLPNLVTNLDVPACQEAAGDDGYAEGIAYALDALAPLDNVYAYIDAGHSGWLGWDSNFGPAVDLIASVILDTNEGWDSVAGFITNTANYTPTIETYLPNPSLNVSGQPIRSADIYEWNPYFDEKSFAQEFRNKMIAKGAPSTIGMLIDTSRNGWGGSDRPTGVSTSSDLNTYVDQSRIDRRYHRGNWCNQYGGIGFKPWPDPYPGIDAFVWAKPPGESDGIADPNFPVDPDDPNKKHDGMCDPNAQNVDNSAVGTGAMPGAPHAGRWHSEGFQILLENAYPPANEPAGPPQD